MTASRSDDGGPLVVATVHNTGGRALDMAGELELQDGPGGLHAGPFPATLGASLAIGDSGHVAIPLDQQIPDGPWEATITLRSGLLERTAQATLTFPRAGSATTVPTAPIEHRWSLLVIAGSLAALLGALLLWAIVRRGRDNTTPDTSPPPTGNSSPPPRDELGSRLEPPIGTGPVAVTATST